MSRMTDLVYHRKTLVPRNLEELDQGHSHMVSDLDRGGLGSVPHLSSRAPDSSMALLDTNFLPLLFSL